jgi:hypothetical protein
MNSKFNRIMTERPRPNTGRAPTDSAHAEGVHGELVAAMAGGAFDSGPPLALRDGARQGAPATSGAA